MSLEHASIRIFALFVLALMVAASGCSTFLDRSCSEERDICPPDSVCQEGRCVSASTDGDADGDTDGDADTDADTDGDGDVDADGDSDGDSDGDGDADPDADFEAEIECGTEPEVCWSRIGGAVFMMGSDEEEPGRAAFETLHEVTLTNVFKIQTTEVNQRDFEALMGFNDSAHGSSKMLPVDSVTWHQAAAYCNALTALLDSVEPCYDCQSEDNDYVCESSGELEHIYDCEGYRLPTEAEWEYAARGGTDTATYNGDFSYDDEWDSIEVLNEIAWYNGSAGSSPHPVGELEPNLYGLSDMIGNVTEWCHDSADYTLRSYGTDPETDPVSREGYARIVRGCDFASPISRCRAAFRDVADPIAGSQYRGFRCVRTVH